MFEFKTLDDTEVGLREQITTGSQTAVVRLLVAKKKNSIFQGVQLLRMVVEQASLMESYSTSTCEIKGDIPALAACLVRCMK